ncbi:hypothetical protein AMK16_03360 [Streptomyces sp. CB00455]|uniref:hypothetical protein n=1 Tax=Streptomyces sp. CB00455 TaxID=1703927 RepID=UPI00093C5D5C|nr:hypothetical protein [Streptomyces sp. CB00455]OKK22228.1 hypothetical protein AMK16_03360 [Streptomyces sp. CB00455]
MAGTEALGRLGEGARSDDGEADGCDGGRADELADGVEWVGAGEAPAGVEGDALPDTARVEGEGRGLGDRGAGSGPGAVISGGEAGGTGRAGPVSGAKTA